VRANDVKYMRPVIVIAAVKIMTFIFFIFLFAIDVRVIQLTIEVKYSSKYPLICLAVVLGDAEIFVHMTGEFIKVTWTLGRLFGERVTCLKINYFAVFATNEIRYLWYIHCKEPTI